MWPVCTSFQKTTSWGFPPLTCLQFLNSACNFSKLQIDFKSSWTTSCTALDLLFLNSSKNLRRPAAWLLHKTFQHFWTRVYESLQIFNRNATHFGAFPKHVRTIITQHIMSSQYLPFILTSHMAVGTQNSFINRKKLETNACGPMLFFDLFTCFYMFLRGVLLEPKPKGHVSDFSSLTWNPPRRPHLPGRSRRSQRKSLRSGVSLRRCWRSLDNPLGEPRVIGNDKNNGQRYFQCICFGTSWHDVSKNSFLCFFPRPKRFPFPAEA